MEKPNSIGSEMIMHWDMVRKLDGKRPILESHGIVPDSSGIRYPDEYVINGYLEEYLKRKIQSKGYPLKRNKYGESSLDRPGDIWEQDTISMLGTKDILLLLLPDITIESGWHMEYIAISDLMVDDPSILYDEAFAALENGNERLASCKGQAYLALNGSWNYPDILL
jgi:hypothetical protein